MDWKREWRRLAILLTVFVACMILPVDNARFSSALLEALHLVRWYAREHVLLCLVPAFFIAGAIAVFVSKASVMKYLGPQANKVLAYGVASVSGSVLAVCSCTVLPLFAGIYRMGAGLGPASAFLYAGPAVNVLAIILTARVLGVELGIARAVGAVLFSIVIGLLMHCVFRKQELQDAAAQIVMPEEPTTRPLWQNTLYFLSMVGVLVFANWGEPSETTSMWHAVYANKWNITSAFAVALGLILVCWLKLAWWKVLAVALPTAVLAVAFSGKPLIPFTVALVGLTTITATSTGETKDWLVSSWEFTWQIAPLLLLGVLAAGFLLGRPDHEGVIPSSWIAGLVGGNSWQANLFASVVGAFMYFATLTEVPILQGLMGAGMGKGPALALLLAGPALSLPNMLVIRSVMGNVKTVVYILLVVALSTLAGILYGAFF